jgi:leucyl/phenylalanyl-tRNA--protein transferase
MHAAPEPDVRLALSAYAQGLFPMDDSEADSIPFYTADPRAIFEMTAAARAALRRRLRRSLKRDPGWRWRIDGAFETVLAGCMAPRGPGEGVWLTPRLAELYRGMHAAGFGHSFELWDEAGPVAGVLGVVLGRAAMLESMFHTASHAGNVCLVRTLDGLAERGLVLCDIQLPTDHTMRLGARLIPATEYAQRLRDALA